MGFIDDVIRTETRLLSWVIWIQRHIGFYGKELDPEGKILTSLS